MTPKKPDYEDWGRKPDLKGETPDTPQGHRILVWLWVIGLIVFSAIVWGLGKLTSYLQPGPHDNTMFILSFFSHTFSLLR
jgi:hypothetical protein